MSDTDTPPPSVWPPEGERDAYRQLYFEELDAGRCPPVEGWLRRQIRLDPVLLHDLEITRAGGPDEPPPAAADLPSIPGCQLSGEVWHGGMGVVYRAVRTADGRAVAVKMIAPPHEGDRGHRVRFRQEATRLEAVEHPNVVQVLHNGTTADRPYLVMEWLGGGDLRQRAAAPGRSPVERMRDLARAVAAVADAVAAVHAANDLHRDIKPENVLFDDRGNPKLVDWGLCRPERASGLTQEHEVIGTPAYMSPEQGQPGAVHTRGTDIYGLAATLYSALYGRPPFGTLSGIALAAAVQNRPPDAPAERLATDPAGRRVEEHLEAVWRRCMEKNPLDRYPSAAAVAADLRKVAAGEVPSAARPDPKAWAAKQWRRNKLLVRATAVAAVLLVGIVAVGFARDAARQQDAANTLQAKNDELKDAGDALTANYAELKKANAELKGKNKELADSLYNQRIVTAYQEVRDRNPDRAEKLLDDCPNDLRGWEWGYLKRLTDETPLKPLTHDMGVWGVAAGPNGQLASASVDGIVRVWDATSGAAVGKYTKHAPTLLGQSVPGNPTLYLEFHPAGDGRILSSAANGQIHLWHLDAKFRGPTWEAKHTQFGSPCAVKFTPDGKRVVAASSAGEVNVLDADTGKLVFQFVAHQGRVNGLAMRHDGAVFATCGADRAVRLWRTDTGEAAGVLTGHRSQVRDVAFSPKGTADLIAGCSYDGVVRVWRVGDGSEVAELRGHDSPVLALAFSPDGKRLASAGFDKTIKLWDTATWTEVLTLRGHADMIWTLAWSGDGSKLFSASFDKTVRVWDANPPPPAAAPPDAGEWLTAVAYGPRGELLAAGWHGGTLGLPCRGGADAPKVPSHGTTEVWGVAFNRDGSRCVSTAWDERVRIWNAADGKEVCPPIDVGSMTHTVAARPTADEFAVTLWNGRVLILDGDGKGQGTLLHSALFPVFAAAYSTDGKVIATGGGDRMVNLWDAVTREKLGYLPQHPAAVHGLAFSPNGKLIATACWDGGVRVFDTGTRKELYHLTGHTNRVNTVAFSPDGKWLVSGSEDKTVKGWRVGKLVRADDSSRRDNPPQWEGRHRQPVWGVAFDPTAKASFASVGWDRVVRPWTLPDN